MEIVKSVELLAAVRRKHSKALYAFMSNHLLQKKGGGTAVKVESPFYSWQLPLEKRLRGWMRRETVSGMVFATLAPLCAPLYSLPVEGDSLVKSLST
jgi:hypothetical protein